jgi:hypothetical protein
MINFYINKVESVSINVIERKTFTTSELSINFKSDSIKIIVNPLDSAEPETIIERDNMRWYHIHKLLNSIEDQPVTLDVFEHKVNINFEY